MLFIFSHYISHLYLSATLVYALSHDNDEVVAINRDTGDLRLIRSLVGSSVDTLDVTVYASDGDNKAELHLTIRIVDNNVHAPVFSLSQYYTEVNESTRPGERLLQVSATYLDSASLAYIITGGNTDNAFLLEPLTGIDHVISRPAVLLTYLTSRLPNMIISRPVPLFTYAASLVEPPTGAENDTSRSFPPY